MMEYTLKDLINYCSPCKICNEKCIITLSYNGAVIKNLKINDAIITFVVKTTYNPDKSLFLSIDAKTNKFQANFDLSDMELYFSITCGNKDYCTNIITDYINISETFIKPISVLSETIRINNYTILTDIKKNISIIYYWTPLPYKRSIMEPLTIPALPIPKWKTKENLINLITSYLVFI